MKLAIMEYIVASLEEAPNLKKLIRSELNRPYGILPGGSFMALIYKYRLQWKSAIVNINQ